MRIVIVVGMLLLVCNLSAVALFLSLPPDLPGAAPGAAPTAAFSAAQEATSTLRPTAIVPDLPPDEPIPSDTPAPTAASAPLSAEYVVLRPPLQYDESFGSQILLADSLLIVAEPVAHCGGTSETRAGLVRVFHRTDTGPGPGTWERVARLEPNLSADSSLDDAAANQGYPCSGALRNAEFGSALTLSGDLLAVAAPGYVRGDGGKGVVFIFRRAADDGSKWVGLEMLTPSASEADTRFGTSLAMSEGRLAVGTDHGPEQAGTIVYVYQKLGDHFSEQMILTTPGTSVLGGSLAFAEDALFVGILSPDGNMSSILIYQLADGEDRHKDAIGVGGIFALQDGLMPLIYRLPEGLPDESAQSILIYRTSDDPGLSPSGAAVPPPPGVAYSALESIATDGRRIAIGASHAYPDESAQRQSAIFVYDTSGLIAELHQDPLAEEGPYAPGGSVAILGGLVAAGNLFDSVWIFYVP